MSGAPESVNPALTSADNAIDFIMMDVLANVAYGLAIAQVPFLGFPVINVVFKAALNWIFRLVKAPIMKLTDFAIIDHQVGGEVKALAEAKAAVIDAHMKGKDDTEAKQALHDSFRNLIHSGGA